MRRNLLGGRFEGISLLKQSFSLKKVEKDFGETTRGLSWVSLQLMGQWVLGLILVWEI